MASETELLALADKVANAANPVEVVQLNGDVLRALGWTSDAACVYDPAGERRSGIPSYTLSVDDAAKLVLPGWNWMAGNRDQPVARAYVNNGEMAFEGAGMRRNPRRQWYEVTATTPALALCAAALKARAATMGGSDD